MTILDAVVYDLDGILIDLDPLWEEAEIEAFARVGIEMQHEEYLQVQGLRTEAAVNYWYQRKPWDLTAHHKGDVAHWIEHGVMERMTARGSLLTGVHESVEFFRSRGTRLALASTSSFAIINHALTTLDLGTIFEVVHSAQNEINGKPFPDVYESTLQLLGVHAAEACAIEGSKNGITAAVAAGMKCIAVSGPHALDASTFEQADVVLTSLLEIDEEVIWRLGAQLRH